MRRRRECFLDSYNYLCHPIFVCRCFDWDHLGLNGNRKAVSTKKAAGEEMKSVKYFCDSCDEALTPQSEYEITRPGHDMALVHLCTGCEKKLIKLLRFDLADSEAEAADE